MNDFFCPDHKKLIKRFTIIFSVVVGTLILICWHLLKIPRYVHDDLAAGWPSIREDWG